MGTINRIPAHLPVGTRYVIEGRPGKSGKMRIISRQLILPNGTQYDLGKIEISARSFERPRADRRKRSSSTKGVAKKASTAKKAQARG